MARRIFAKSAGFCRWRQRGVVAASVRDYVDKSQNSIRDAATDRQGLWMDSGMGARSPCDVNVNIRADDDDDVAVVVSTSWVAARGVVSIMMPNSGDYLRAPANTPPRDRRTGRGVPAPRSADQWRARARTTSDPATTVD